MSDNENTPVNEAINEDAVETAEIATADAASASAGASHGRRQEKIGLVTSNKMTKTVVVRVERQVRHPKYKRYIRRRKKFMAHDELGVNVGDIVRIIETRPMSARKRWRVIEVVQKAS
jgi:small subunit ribosomal protein S17